jgi:hypothetical protein
MKKSRPISNEHYGDRGGPFHALGDAALYDPRNASTAMGSHCDQSGTRCFGFLHDLLRRLTEPHGEPQRDRAQARRHALEVRPMPPVNERNNSARELRNRIRPWLASFTV